MIYLRLAGGLGNQIFQLAAALSVSKANKEKIVLYSKSLKKYKVSRDFKLSFLGFSDFKKIKSKHKIILKFRLGKFLSLFSNSFISDQNFLLRNFKKTVFLDGYFHDIKKVNSGMLNLKKRYSKINIKNILDKLNLKIDFENDVAVHVRRGDYNSEKNRKIYKYLGYEYYKTSLEKMDYRNVYIFCTEQIDFILDNNQVEMYNYNLNDVEDFMLMSKFKKIIISNSTFAFCSAFFSQYNDKFVVAPKEYYVDKKQNKLWLENYKDSKFIVNNKI